LPHQRYQPVQGARTLRLINQFAAHGIFEDISDDDRRPNPVFIEKGASQRFRTIAIAFAADYRNSSASGQVIGDCRAEAAGPSGKDNGFPVHVVRCVFHST
jgi:hypothetical protein